MARKAPTPKGGEPAPRSLAQFADAEAEARYAEHAEIARTSRTLRSALADKEKVLAELTARLGLYERLDAARLHPPEWLTPKTPTRKHVGIPTMLFTDLHWTEVVKPEQIGGINCYNLAIAEQRSRRAFEQAIVLARDYLKGVQYEGFSLMLGGDLLSGDIHDELKETNAETVEQSVLTVLEPLEAGINLLAKEFKRVSIAGVVGNHPRNSRKPRMKNRPQNNMDWLVYKLIERDFRGRKDVAVQVADGPDITVPVYGTKFLLTHGDQFQGGSGIAGALSPLLLGAHRKTRRQSAAGQPYDVMVMGHWHESWWAPSKGLIVGGSVIGYNEYAYTKNLMPEPPQCAYWITTPQHGVTFPLPIFTSDRKAEGW